MIFPIESINKMSSIYNSSTSNNLKPSSNLMIFYILFFSFFRELLPMIDSLRDNLAHRVAAKWKDMFKLTLSFADGSSARVSAINAALKPYRFVLNKSY